MDLIDEPAITLASRRANTRGQAQWVVRGTQWISAQGPVWLQAVEVNRDGLRRITLPLLATDSPSGS